MAAARCPSKNETSPGADDPRHRAVTARTDGAGRRNAARPLGRATGTRSRPAYVARVRRAGSAARSQHARVEGLARGADLRANHHRSSFHCRPRPGTMFNLTPMAKTADGQIMVLVRSSAIFLWHAGATRQTDFRDPASALGSRACTGSVQRSARGATAGAEHPPLRFRAVQLAPDGDRIYLIDQKRPAACLGDREPSGGLRRLRFRPATWIGRCR